MAERDDFLILHHPVDRAWAEWIVWQLEQGWFTATLVAWDAGAPLAPVLQRAESQVDRLLVVFSGSLSGALARDASAGAAIAGLLPDRARLVAAPVRPCRFERPPPDPIDLAGLDEEPALEVLMSGAARGRPGQRPIPTRFDEALRQSTRRPVFPGARAPVFRVPSGRWAAFEGREEALTAVREALEVGPCALVAESPRDPEGWGLSAIAREHAYRAAGRHAVVWWARACDPLVLDADMAALAPALALPERTARSMAAVREAVRRWFAEHDDWLLVLDRAADAELVRAWLPSHAGGQVLITGIELPGSVKIGALPTADAERFVARRVAPGSPDGAAELARLLAGNPLALHLAAGAASLLDRTPAQIGAELARAMERGAPRLAACAALALDALRERLPAAAELVRVAAWLAPEEVPLKLFETSEPYLRPELASALGDHDRLHDIVHAAERAGLVEEVREDHVSLHPAVAAAVRAAQPPDARAATSRSASALVCYGGSFFFHDGTTWTAQARWRPHARAVVRHVAAEGAVTRQTLELARNLADTLANSGELAQALDGARDALAIAERLEGPDSREASRCVSELAWLHGRLGHRPERRSLLTRALAIAERAGAEPREVGDRLIELAAEHQAAGEPDAALPLLHRAAETLGTQPDAAVVHRRLAELFTAKGDTTAAAAAEAAARELEDLFGI